GDQHPAATEAVEAGRHGSSRPVPEGSGDGAPASTTPRTTNWGGRVSGGNTPPRYSPSRPSMTSCTPEDSTIGTSTEAQHAGNPGRSSRSSNTSTPSASPSALHASPTTVLTRSGITEKFTNMLSQRRRSFRAV